MSYRASYLQLLKPGDLKERKIKPMRGFPAATFVLIPARPTGCMGVVKSMDQLLKHLLGLLVLSH
jgi:hypothetical protein